LGFALLRTFYTFPHNLDPHRPFLFVSPNSSENESISIRTMANSAADECMKVVRQAEKEHPSDPFYAVPPQVYDQIIEACRPFYALRGPADASSSLPGSSPVFQAKYLQLPLRFEDSVAQHQRPKAATAKRRVVSPSPEVRLCKAIPRSIEALIWVLLASHTTTAAVFYIRITPARQPEEHLDVLMIE
jgi:hypothetical protein